jgi:hypothetical protein
MLSLEKIVNEFKAMGINVISYFIYEGSIFIVPYFTPAIF